MQSIETKSVGTANLRDPALVEGLPGAGLVGTLAANHLVEELDGEAVRQIFSEYFPPVVSVDGKGTATLDPITVFAIRTDGRDLLVLAGRAQAQESIGQYRLAEALLDIADEFGVSEIFTLGGSVLGEPVENHTVGGAVADGSDRLKARLEAAGVSFDGKAAPVTVGGVSGLLLGLAPQRDLPAASLLGTTSGYHVDPNSAKVVLDVLSEFLDFSVDISAFTERPEAKKKSVRKTQKLLQMNLQEKQGGGEGLRYFG